MSNRFGSVAFACLARRLLGKQCAVVASVFRVLLLMEHIFIHIYIYIDTWEVGRSASTLGGWEERVGLGLRPLTTSANPTKGSHTEPSSLEQSHWQRSFCLLGPSPSESSCWYSFFFFARPSRNGVAFPLLREIERPFRSLLACVYTYIRTSSSPSS